MVPQRAYFLSVVAFWTWGALSVERPHGRPIRLAGIYREFERCAFGGVLVDDEAIPHDQMTVQVRPVSPRHVALTALRAVNAAWRPIRTEVPAAPGPRCS